jgi:hypothetical protein
VPLWLCGNPNARCILGPSQAAPAALTAGHLHDPITCKHSDSWCMELHKLLLCCGHPPASMPSPLSARCLRLLSGLRQCRSVRPRGSHPTSSCTSPCSAHTLLQQRGGGGGGHTILAGHVSHNVL